MDTTLGIDFYLADPSQELYQLEPGERYLFGRSGDASFVLTDTLSSREHCEIAWNDRKLPVLRDLGSRNGTYHNGKKIDGFCDLSDRDQVQIGGTRFTMHLLPSGSDVEGLLARETIADLNRMETFELSDSDLDFDATSTFSGSLRERGMAGMLRFFSLTDKTGLLVLDDQEEKQVWFVDGTPRDAVCKNLKGLEALRAIIDDPGDSFAFHEDEKLEGPQTIDGSEEEVLSSVLPATELADLGIDAADLEQAQNVQKHLLARIPDLPGYEIGLYFRGLSGVSGDCYDVGYLADGRALIFLADVSGHGIQAAMVVTNILKTLRMLRGRHHDLVELLSDFNDEIKPDLLTGQFCTVFTALLDPATGKAEIALAGHHAGLMFPVDTGDPVCAVGNRGLGIGLATGSTFRNSLHIDHIDMKSGDVILQYTDGLVEAMNASQEDYGEERLQQSITRLCRGNVQELVDAMAEDVLSYAGSAEDDLTLLAIHRTSSDDSSRFGRPSGQLAAVTIPAPEGKPAINSNTSSGTMLNVSPVAKRQHSTDPGQDDNVPAVQVHLPRVSERLKRPPKTDAAPIVPHEQNTAAAIQRLQRMVMALMAVILILVLVIVGLALLVVLRS